MKNFEVIDKKTEKKYWISRSIAVAGFIIVEDKDSNGPCFLLERRGPGAADNIGKLCCPCGYLDFEETTKEAIWRECLEETGLDFSECTTSLWYINDDPNADPRQNVTFRYVIKTPGYLELKDYIEKFDPSILSGKGGEDNEISELVLLGLDEIKNLKSSDFAFGHKECILDLMKI